MSISGVLLSVALSLGGTPDFRTGRLYDTTLHLRFQSEGACSGTVVGKDIILSAEHCFLEDTLITADGAPVEVLEVVADGNDHVLVRVDKMFDKWAPLANSKSLRVRERVWWMGNPGGEIDVYREGYVSRLAPDEIVIDAQIYNGDSGAGIFDKRGRVVGVISSIGVLGVGHDYQMTVALAYPLAFTSEQIQEVSR